MSERLGMLAVIQEQDLEEALRALRQQGLPTAFLSSSGGFLGRRNATLLIHLRAEQVEKALQALQASCRERVEYMTLPLEGSPFPVPTSLPVTVGGATVFTLPIEYFEEL